MRLSAFKFISRLALLLFILCQALPLAGAVAHADGALSRAGSSYAAGSTPAANGGHAHCAGSPSGCGECQALPSASPVMTTNAAKPDWPDYTDALPLRLPHAPPRRPPRI
ncbi:hypothetical protein VK98_10725 [Chromobacterium sp. LK11]|uniref:hypothetical protein n=1 Tax=Chromobacterium sp. LK11 TaxID=1628212 RepID=UPI0006548D4A|nr:hypothetical protein [Chromobacterium sp. LK11]KMN82075.1 hypothetical protein VK98_10725 [Chromobacterium sp. LK11]